MSGLVISLKPEEKFLVNGALLINGPKRGQIRIGGEGVNVLRLSDAIHPDSVCSPISRVYYNVQIFLSGDAALETVKADIDDGLLALCRVFEGTNLADMAAKSQRAFKAGHYYSTLCALKPLLAIESDLISYEAPEPKDVDITLTQTQAPTSDVSCDLAVSAA